MMTRERARECWLEIRRLLDAADVWSQFEETPNVGKRASREILLALRSANRLCRGRFPSELDEGITVLRKWLAWGIQAREDPLSIDLSHSADRVIAEFTAQHELALRTIRAVFDRWNLELPSDEQLIQDVATEIARDPLFLRQRQGRLPRTKAVFPG
jgi:hypothetical protein